MKPVPFEYRAPATLQEALELLAEYGDEAKPLAGGQSLIPAMNFRLACPAVLIDLNRVPGLSDIEEASQGELRIGAMTRQRSVEISDVVARRAPLLSAAMPSIAHVQIRNRGTIGGSLAHADPAAELPAVASALGARFKLQRRDGERWVAARDFFTGLFETALEPGELLTQIAFPPLPERAAGAFHEFARRHGDYALAGVAVQVSWDQQGRFDDASIACLGVGEGPVLAAQAAESLRGHPVDLEAIEQASELAGRQDVDPPGDIHASSAYRRHLVQVLVRRSLTQACRRILADPH